MDASILNCGGFRVGFILRDSMGFPLEAGRKRLLDNPSIVEAETKSKTSGICIDSDCS